VSVPPTSSERLCADGSVVQSGLIKVWKLSDMDLKSYSRWYDYSQARDAMFAATEPPGRPGTSPAPTTTSGAGSTSSATR
jgi:Polyphosphate kinase 2 (PPK2)